MIRDGLIQGWLGTQEFQHKFFILALQVQVNILPPKGMEVVNFRVFHLRETLPLHLILLHLLFRLDLRHQ